VSKVNQFDLRHTLFLLYLATKSPLQMTNGASAIRIYRLWLQLCLPDVIEPIPNSKDALRYRRMLLWDSEVWCRYRRMLLSKSKVGCDASNKFNPKKEWCFGNQFSPISLQIVLAGDNSAQCLFRSFLLATF